MTSQPQTKSLPTSASPRLRKWETLLRYAPSRPWRRQAEFLDLDCLEAFYGGAAAGGKSHALLMAALQYVDVPGYAALILRRDTRRLGLSGGLIPRSHEWLAEKGATWNAGKSQWVFPTSGAPATITFGYLNNSLDKFRYGSSEYQFIAFDELTEFSQEDYLFLFSRLRKRRDMQVPLRMRSASNPGGRGHDWVKQRFVVPPNPAEASPTSIQPTYIPARLEDNPGIIKEEYARSLELLPAVWRERMLRGDWDAAEEGVARKEWFRYFTQADHIVRLWHPDGRLIAELDDRQMRCIITIDPAGTDARAAHAAERSASAMQVWNIARKTSTPYLILRAAYHEQLAFQALRDRIAQLHQAYQPDSIFIENEKLGQALVSSLEGMIPIHSTSTQGKSKLERATDFLKKLERGEVYFPKQSTRGVDQLAWELVSWNGESKISCDQIDAAAYAARQCDQASDVIKIASIVLR